MISKRFLQSRKVNSGCSAVQGLIDLVYELPGFVCIGRLPEMIKKIGGADKATQSGNRPQMRLLVNGSNQKKHVGQNSARSTERNAR